MTSYCCWVRSEIELLSGGRLATFFPTLFFRSKKGSHNFPSQSSHLLTPSPAEPCLQSHASRAMPVEPCL